ncbi:MAG: hypothetical protein IJW10_05515 [Clostridia bacterium]|nr:hypothetical protein [Clostridia bacterium]
MKSRVFGLFGALLAVFCDEKQRTELGSAMKSVLRRLKSALQMKSLRGEIQKITFGLKLDDGI